MDISAAAAAYNAQSDIEGWEQLCDPALAFSHRDFDDLHAVWNGLAGRGAMPLRAEMTARVLKPFLPRIALKERVEMNPSRYRWRLMGTLVAQTVGERTGKLADENVPPRLAARANSSCDMTLAMAAPLRFVGRVLAKDKDHLVSETLYLPLAGGDGAARYVMGFGFYSAMQDWRHMVRVPQIVRAS